MRKIGQITKTKIVVLQAALSMGCALWSLPSFAQTYGTCYQQTFKAICEQMRKSPSLHPKTSYGEVIANPYGAAKRTLKSEDVGLRKRSEEEMKFLFAQAKRALLRQLFGEKPLEQLSPDARSIHGRIASSVYLDRSSSHRKAFCANNDDDNAAYFGRFVNGVVFCDDMSRNPTVSVLETLSHELTHSLDPVNMRKNFYLADVDPIQYIPSIVSTRKNPKVLRAVDAGLAPILRGTRDYPFQHALDIFVSGDRNLPKMKQAHLKEAIPDSFGALAIKNHFLEMKEKNPSYRPTPSDLIAPFGTTIEEACGVEDSPLESSANYAAFALRFEAIYMADPVLADVYQCPWLSTGSPLHAIE